MNPEFPDAPDHRCFDDVQVRIADTGEKVDWESLPDSLREDVEREAVEQSQGDDDEFLPNDGQFGVGA